MKKKASEMVAGDVFIMNDVVVKVSKVHVSDTYVLLYADAGATITASPEDLFLLDVEDLTAYKILSPLGKPGEQPYEVLAFHTQHEYDSTERETDLKKKIVAKFRDYDDALVYARKQAEKSYLYKVILR